MPARSTTTRMHQKLAPATGTRPCAGERRADSTDMRLPFLAPWTLRRNRRVARRSSPRGWLWAVIGLSGTGMENRCRFWTLILQAGLPARAGSASNRAKVRSAAGGVATVIRVRKGDHGQGFAARSAAIPVGIGSCAQKVTSAAVSPTTIP